MNAHRRLSLVAVTATVLVVVAGLAVRASTETSPAATQPSDDFAGPMQADPGVSPADSRTANPGPGEMYLGHGIYEVVRVADADALAGAGISAQEAANQVVSTYGLAKYTDRATDFTPTLVMWGGAPTWWLLWSVCAPIESNGGPSIGENGNIMPSSPVATADGCGIDNVDALVDANSGQVYDVGLNHGD